MTIQFVICIFANIIILTAFIMALRLRRLVDGGIVKSTWNILTVLIGLFVIGYLLTPFFSFLSMQAKDLVVSLVFFFGAIFVIIVIQLLRKIVKGLGM